MSSLSFPQKDIKRKRMAKLMYLKAWDKKKKRKRKLGMIFVKKMLTDAFRLMVNNSFK